MPSKNYIYITISFLLLTVFFIGAKAQNAIKGIVTDSITGELLSNVSIFFTGTTIGTTTDNSGKFSLKALPIYNTLSFVSLGYHDKTLKLSDLKSNSLKITLAPNTYDIKEIIIKPQKEKYRKKDNPAVNFVKKVIENKAKYDPHTKDYYQYNHSQRIDLAVNNFKKDKNKGLINKFSFLTSFVDTSVLSGKPILPVSTKEMMEEYYYQKYPRIEKKIIIDKKSSGIDDMLSEDGVNQFLTEVLKNVDIYENNITLFLKEFVSPLSTGGPDFYKYYLLDTVQIAGVQCIDLGFVPFSSESSGFSGHLYITLDSTTFVKKVKLNFPKNINLNFIQNMSIEQEFDRTSDAIRLLIRDDIIVEFSLLAKSDGLYARRTSTYSHHSFTQPVESSIFKQQGTIISLEDIDIKPESYWTDKQLDTIHKKENSVDIMLKKLRSNPLFYYSEKVFSAFVTGYIPTSATDNKFNLGPMYTSISTNTAEGLRLRVGGYTTAQLNKHWFGNGYLAYGTTDQKPKGLAQIEYSFNKKKKQANEFPINSIRASYYYDMNRLGQNYLYSPPDNLFLSLKRQKDDKITYLRKIEMSYNREFHSQFSAGLDFRYRTEYASTYIPFIENTTGTNLASYSLGEMQLRLRYAPGEKFYQTLGNRRSFTRNAPVFTFSHTQAFKGILNSDYDYSHTEVNFQQRFWFSAYGNATVILKAGKVWTKAPFPILIIPNANLSYTIQYESYPMMNAMEFMNDQYFSWDLNYNMNGIILNQIPVLKKFKLREIVSFRGLYGNLSSKNDPLLTKNLFEFPATTYRMDKKPYMEVGVGVVNIFKFLRVDYIWRLNYLDHRNIDKSGIRISMDFYF